MKSRNFTYRVLNNLRVFGLSLLLVVISQGLSAQSVNLLTNPSMEDEGDPSNIAPWTNWGGCAISTTEAHTGKQSLVVTSDNWGGAGNENRVGLYEGREFTFSAWAKLSQESASWFILAMQLTWGGAIDEAHKISCPPELNAWVTTTEWTKVGLTWVVPRDSVDNLIPWFGTGEAPGGALFYLDDFEFTCSNMAVNPGFEKEGTWNIKGNANEVDFNGTGSPSHTGNSAAKVTPKTDNGAGFGQTIPIALEVGANYTLSAFCAANTEKSGAKIVAICRDRYPNSDGSFPTQTFSQDIIYNKDGYQETKMTFSLPDSKDSVYIGVWCPTKDVSVVFDDLKLVQTTDTATVGVKNLLESSVKVSLYPNPLNGTQLNVTTVGLTGNKTLDIYDMSGKLVFNEKLQYTNNQFVDVSSVKMKGVYIVCIRGNEGTKTQKLVVQ